MSAESSLSEIEIIIADEDPTGENVKFEAMEIPSEELDELDTIFIPMRNESEIIKGSNPIFDFFVEQNEKCEIQFGFLNTVSDSGEFHDEGWEVAPHKLQSLFYKVGFPAHRQSILAYLNKNATTSSDGLTRSCFFNINAYNDDPDVQEKLILDVDYEHFSPLKMITDKPMLIDGQFYFAFPASQYLFYRNSYSFLQLPIPPTVLVFGINGQTHSSLFRAEVCPEYRLHYIHLDNPVGHFLLSYKRRYDFITFKYSAKKGQYLIDDTQTHPLLVRHYGRKVGLINAFFETLDTLPKEVHNEDNPFVRVKKDEKGVYLTCVSALYLESIIARYKREIPLEDTKKIIEHIIACGKKEGFILQKQENEPVDDDSDPSPELDPNRPFYLMVEDGVYQRTLKEIKPYLE